MREVNADDPTDSGFWNQYKDLECDEDCTDYLKAALLDDPAYFADALHDVAVARLINNLAATTGVDRLKLCSYFAGDEPLDPASIARIAETMLATQSDNAPVLASAT